MTADRARSRLVATPQGHRLVLAASDVRGPAGQEPGPTLYAGRPAQGDVVVAGLLALTDVATSSYDGTAPPRDPAHVDPVVTVAGDRLRFESFSACNGVHARFDLLCEGPAESEGEGPRTRGTSVVDLGPGLCAELSGVDRHEPLHLTIDHQAPTPDQGLVPPAEEPGPVLPDRWVRGLSEVPDLMRGMGPRGELLGPAIAGFVDVLPTGAAPGPVVHVVPLPGRWLTSPDPVPGSVPLPGTARVRSLERMLRLARRLRLHAHPDGCTAWELAMPGARFTLVLTADAERGFRGDGALLSRLSHGEVEGTAQRLATALGWCSVVRPERLVDELGLDRDEVEPGLSRLAASGRLGYDLAERAWFHRELPVPTEAVLARHPRLVSAARLIEHGAVIEAADGGAWLVRDIGDAMHAVRRDDEGWRCECTWGLEHRGDRGPCQHVVAVLLSRP